jgi:hypothetical protein
MKILAAIAGVLLGALFLFASVMVLFHLAPMPPLKDDGTAPSYFMLAFAPTGYMTFVKVLEMLGGLLVLVPRTRNLGLLVLGPIIVNILAFHIFVTKGMGLENPMLIAIVVLAAFLLWVERRAWLGLVTR